MGKTIDRGTTALTMRNIPSDIDAAIMAQAKVVGTPKSDYWFDDSQTLTENREYCRILGIFKEEVLQRIMMSGMPWREIRAAPAGRYAFTARYFDGICPFCRSGDMRSDNFVGASPGSVFSDKRRSIPRSG
ncbi:hypothetical protein [Edaphovirga cremea]|uniref:hypothetical protein n=1 Tax=Edaphovirga cremea TaxID=2267246 RepID=UPI001FEBFB2A|nr:hypothetical protein [Edaphovirga cremea]